MKSYAPYRLEEAVAAICPDIEARVASRELKASERNLWYELSCCLLSSQVPYTLAIAATDAIDRNGSMLEETVDTTSLEPVLAQILSEPLVIGGRRRAYRFPTMRASQLAATRTAVTQASGTLESLLASFKDPTDARSWLVANAPGIGPKQASMFLRNIGISYDLAILDRHVLNYMTALNIYPEKKRLISGLVNYRRHEDVLITYAQKMGVKVGLLDWAIWIVMRAVQSSQSMEVTA